MLRESGPWRTQLFNGYHFHPEAVTWPWRQVTLELLHRGPVIHALISEHVRLMGLLREMDEMGYYQVRHHGNPGMMNLIPAERNGPDRSTSGGGPFHMAA